MGGTFSRKSESLSPDFEGKRHFFKYKEARTLSNGTHLPKKGLFAKKGVKRLRNENGKSFYVITKVKQYILTKTLNKMKKTILLNWDLIVVSESVVDLAKL